MPTSGRARTRSRPPTGNEQRIPLARVRVIDSLFTNDTVMSGHVLRPPVTRRFPTFRIRHLERNVWREFVALIHLFSEERIDEQEHGDEREMFRRSSGEKMA